MHAERNKEMNVILGGVLSTHNVKQGRVVFEGLSKNGYDQCRVI